MGVATVAARKISLEAEHLEDIRLAASKMTGARRRAFQAEMALKYCSGSARRAEEVFGWSTAGTLTEYACVPADNLASVPANVSVAAAATVPTSALTAFQAIREIANVKPGQTVLVTGASGGVGSFAVQIAKAIGAEVTGVCSTRNVELVRSIGADHVVDYTMADFTCTEKRYDVILDNVEA